MPRVSIVIPHHNHGEYLEETLRSARLQTWKDVEILVVDDGSTDSRSLELLRSLERDGLRVFWIQNGGPSKARNLAIAEATGDYILPLDADDLIDPNAVEALVEVLERTGAAVAIPRTLMFGCNTGELFLGRWDRGSVLVSNVAPCTSMFRKTDWERLGGYNENMTEGYEDWDFWMSFLEQRLESVHVDQAVFHYRIKRQSRNPGQERLLAQARMHARMLSNHPGLLDGAQSLLHAYYRAIRTTWTTLLWRWIVGIPSRLARSWWERFPTPSPKFSSRSEPT